MTALYSHITIWFKAPVRVKYSIAGVVGHIRFICSSFNIHFPIQFGIDFNPQVQGGPRIVLIIISDSVDSVRSFLLTRKICRTWVNECKTCSLNFIKISHILTNLNGFKSTEKFKITIHGILGAKKGLGLLH